jgi:hypothetical protein
VCEADSDGDGLTNGEELGNSKCQWSTNGHILLSNLTVSHYGSNMCVVYVCSGISFVSISTIL